MSPEINDNNSNQPPRVTKRKKKKTHNASNSTSNDTLDRVLENGYSNEYGAFNGDLYDPSNDYYIYQKRECSLPPPPGSQPMSLPVYPGYPRYPTYPSHPPPVQHQQQFLMEPRYPNFMPGPMAGPMPGPPLRQYRRHPSVYVGNYPCGQIRPTDQSHDYTSLPPINLNIENFDPGSPHESDCSGSNSCVDSDRNYEKLSEEIKYLRNSNKILSNEVAQLKQEVSWLKQDQKSKVFEREYQPGMLADIIKEVRDAARVREDALLARVKYVIEEKYLGLNINVAEKSRTSDRIAKIEDQIKSLTALSSSRSEDCSTLLAISPTSNSTSSTPVLTSNEKSKTALQVLELEREALELRRELQARTKKVESNESVFQLSKMLQRTDISASDTVSSEDGKTSVDSVSTTSTMITPFSPPPPVPPRVILSGPVTDL